MLDDGPEDVAGGSSEWCLIDPRSTIEECPYTFFVPSDAEKAALESGNLVKLIFESLDPEEDSIERMWVIFRGRDEHGYFGNLDNEPYDIQGLSAGDMIHFDDFNIIAVWEPKFDTPEDEDRFFARCHVDPRILYDDKRIGRLVRRKPKRQWWWSKPRLYPDTGWHIYANDESTPKRKEMEYVAIGALLNKDNSFLPLLDAPVGACLVRDGDKFRLT